MPSVRALRRLAGSAVLALALTAPAVAVPAAPAHAAAPPVGSTACHVSGVYGLQCGPVTAVNLTITFPGGQVIHGVFRYSACVSSRDSGTPVFGLPSGQQVGTVIGGSGTTPGLCTTFALPLA